MVFSSKPRCPPISCSAIASMPVWCVEVITQRRKYYLAQCPSCGSKEALYFLSSTTACIAWHKASTFLYIVSHFTKVNCLFSTHLSQPFPVRLLSESVCLRSVVLVTLQGGLRAVICRNRVLWLACTTAETVCWAARSRNQWLHLNSSVSQGWKTDFSGLK